VLFFASELFSRGISMSEEQPLELAFDGLITSQPDVMAGRRVFRGTRVPIEVVFENLADGMSLDEILTQYNTLVRHDVVRVIELASAALSRPRAA
jgi:uncharacterized protein (DUF433 family)